MMCFRFVVARFSARCPKKTRARAHSYKPIFALSIVLLSLNVFAGENKWTSNGPYGGYFQSFSFHPQNEKLIFASSLDGLFRSTNGGTTWEHINISGGEFVVRAHSHRPDVLIASNCSDGVFKSVDQGTTWQKIYDYEFEADCFYDMEFHPSTPDILYAVSYYNGVYKSNDGGSSWKAQNAGLDLQVIADCCVDIPQIEVNPMDGKIAYALLPSRQVFKTIDGAQSWQRATSGLRFTEPAHALIINPRNPNILYAGGSNGIYKTMDAGKQWTSSECGCYIWNLAIDPRDSEIVYGVGEEAIKTLDGGRNWQWFTPHPFLSAVLLGVGVQPQNPDHVFVGGFAGGIYRSENRGKTWQTTNQRLDALNIGRLQVHPKDSGHLFAIAGQRVFETHDGGESWDLFMKGQLSSFWVSDIVVHTKNPKLIVAAGYRKKAGAVTLSTDSGKTWKVRSNYSGVNYGCSGCVALDPQDQNVIYLAAMTKEGDMSVPLGLARSTDLGKNWELLNSGITHKDIWVITVDPGNGSRIFVGTGSGKIFETLNGGKTWKNYNTGLDNSSIRTIVIDPNNAKTVYVSTYSSIFKSIDGGHTWQSKMKGLPQSWYNFIGINPPQSQTIFAAGGGGLFVSKDGAESWEKFDSEGLGPYGVWNFAVDPVKPNTFYIGTDRGVFSYTHRTGGRPSMTAVPRL